MRPSPVATASRVARQRPQRTVSNALECLHAFSVNSEMLLTLKLHLATELQSIRAARLRLFDRLQIVLGQRSDSQLP
jgi:hypothetical protein